MAAPRVVFATVGTTSFDELITALDDERVVTTLRHYGFTALRIQIGRGTYLPRTIVPGGNEDEGCFVHPATASKEGKDKVPFTCSYFRFKPSLAQDMAEADWVISHAGAGTITEGLRSGRKMLVVINEGLMDNHQKELANALEAVHVLKSTTCSSLLDNLKQLDTLNFEPFSPSPGTFAQLVDDELFEAAP